MCPHRAPTTCPAAIVVLPLSGQLRHRHLAVGGARVRSASGSAPSRPHPDAVGSLPSGRGVAPCRPSASASSSTTRPASISGRPLSGHDERAGRGVEEGAPRRLADGRTAASSHGASSQGRRGAAASSEGASSQGRGASTASRARVLPGTSSAAAGFTRIGTPRPQQSCSGGGASVIITQDMNGEELHGAMVKAAVSKVSMAALLGILMSVVAPASSHTVSCFSRFFFMAWAIETLAFLCSSRGVVPPVSCFMHACRPAYFCLAVDSCSWCPRLCPAAVRKHDLTSL